MFVECYFGFLNIWKPSISVNLVKPASANSHISFSVVGVPSWTVLEKYLSVLKLIRCVYIRVCTCIRVQWSLTYTDFRYTDASVMP